MVSMYVRAQWIYSRGAARDRVLTGTPAARHCADADREDGLRGSRERGDGGRILRMQGPLRTACARDTSVPVPCQAIRSALPIALSWEADP